MVLDRRQRTCWTSICRSIKHVGGSMMIWKCMTTFGSGVWYKIEARIDKHVYKFILEFFCGLLYIITIYIQIGWSFNIIMIPSTWVRACKNGWHHKHFYSFNGMHNLQIWIPLNTSGYFSKDTKFITLPRDIQELLKSVCSVSSNFSKQDCMALYKSMPQRIDVVLRVEVATPITTNFVGKSNKTKWVYIDSHLTLHHNFLHTLNVMWIFAYMCTSLCNIKSNFLISKRTCKLFTIFCWRWIYSKCTHVM